MPNVTAIIKDRPLSPNEHSEFRNSDASKFPLFVADAEILPPLEESR